MIIINMATSRERIKTIFAGGTPDRSAFWLGNPHPDTWPLYFDAFGIEPGGGTDQAERLRRKLGDDLRWICPQWTAYRHPDNKPIFCHQHDARAGLASGGVFAQCEDVREVDDFPWPNPDYLDFSHAVSALRSGGDVYRASGMWSCFFHDVADFFGMENYFVKMYTDPEVVEAVTRKVCEFYLEANERFLPLANGEVDGIFFGNDFGTQLDLLVSPGLFDRFVMPWFRLFTEQGHRHGCQVILHSCGAIHKVIDRLIDAGVDALHPLQAKAADMDAETWRAISEGASRSWEVSIHRSFWLKARQIRFARDVRRVKALLGPNLVVSPSHEALLPNVSPENVLAMAEAAAED